MAKPQVTHFGALMFVLWITTFWGGWFMGYKLEVSFLWLGVVVLGVLDMLISAIWRKDG